MFSSTINTLSPHNDCVDIQEDLKYYSEIHQSSHQKIEFQEFSNGIHPLKDQYDMLYLIFEFVYPSTFCVTTLSLVCKDWMQVIRKLPIDLNLIYSRELNKISRMIEEGPFFERLNDISLAGNDGIDIVLRVLNLPQVSNMKKLKLVNCSLEMGVEISKRNNLKYMEELRIVDSSICDLGGISLVECENFKNCKVLQFDDCGLNPSFARSLSLSTQMTNLEYLSLNNNNIGDEGLKYLSNSSNLKKITYLSLGRNDIFKEGASYLACSPYITTLKELNLSGNMIIDSGALEVSKIESLTCLNLNGCGLSRTGIEYLTTSPFLSNLKTLRLRDLKYISNNGQTCKRLNTHSDICGILSKSQYLKNLSTLQLNYESLTSKGVELLVESHPNLAYLRNYARNIQMKFYEKKERGRTLMDCSGTLMLRVECQEVDLSHDFYVSSSIFYSDPYIYKVFSENTECTLQ